jgi:hypothetical protein
MKVSNSAKKHSDLKNNLFFVGTIYDSFEALEETMGKLKLERPLFLVYLAKKAFAEEVFKAAEEYNTVPKTQIYSPIKLPVQQRYHRM